LFELVVGGAQVGDLRFGQDLHFWLLEPGRSMEETGLVRISFQATACFKTTLSVVRWLAIVFAERRYASWDLTRTCAARQRGDGGAAGLFRCAAECGLFVRC
jgi:hypothetical protein